MPGVWNPSRPTKSMLCPRTLAVNRDMPIALQDFDKICWNCSALFSSKSNLKRHQTSRKTPCKLGPDGKPIRPDRFIIDEYTGNSRLRTKDEQRERDRQVRFHNYRDREYATTCSNSSTCILIFSNPTDMQISFVGRLEYISVSIVDGKEDEHIRRLHGTLLQGLLTGLILHAMSTQGWVKMPYRSSLQSWPLTIESAILMSLHRPSISTKR